MEIKDKNLKVKVDVCCKDCPKYECYWPRPDPGRFTQGRGYSNAQPGKWLCGRREISGCPESPKIKDAE